MTISAKRLKDEYPSMRFCFLTTTLVFLVLCAFAAKAADKTVHDQKNGFSLSFPEEWLDETPSDKEIRLSVKSADLTCMVSASFYDQSAPGSPSPIRANSWRAGR
ncbi:hypothetical protein [Mesorhizobium sp. J8]|uniref:hypothetical protein n=1 Tax=Mesorhizobium sp. J8 TaxID=2777475 RepID=UPI001CD90ACD|nr:hypothetical protein [Mesorhizobium sp. J8]